MFICLIFFFFFDPKNDPIRDSDPRNGPNRDFFDPLHPYYADINDVWKHRMWV